MDYDKNSFLAGLSVGKTLKGWAGGGSGGGDGTTATGDGSEAGDDYERTVLVDEENRVLLFGDTGILVEAAYNNMGLRITISGQTVTLCPVYTRVVAISSPALQVAAMSLSVQSMMYMGDEIKSLGSVNISVSLAAYSLTAAVSGVGTQWHDCFTRSGQSTAAELKSATLTAQVTGTKFTKEEN